MFEIIQRHGPIIDGPALHDCFEGDHALIRYARDTLNLFATFGQVDHVRRDLWLLEPPWIPEPEHRDEFLCAAVASRALGTWAVAAGTWALMLDGIRLRGLDQTAGVRFMLTPRPSRPGSYCARGAERATHVLSEHSLAVAHRHATVIRGRPVVAVTRPSERTGRVRWVESDRLGAHVLDTADAFLSLLEHPRLAGGYDVAAHAAIPVLGRIGVEAIVDAGVRHPSIAVRRRLAFVLLTAVVRTTRGVTWLGPGEGDLVDDRYERWRIPRALGVERRGAPTVLEPHRQNVGGLVRELNVIDNRRAPLLVPALVRRNDGV
jgi:hypothetical protein